MKVNRILLTLYMVFVGIGYFVHDEFTTGEFWTMFIIAIGVLAICESVDKLREVLKDERRDENGSRY